jgi:hypothetical protein
MNELFFLFSSIHPQSGQVASLCSPLSLYVVEIKFILRNRHRQRVETMQLCWDSLKKKRNQLHAPHPAGRSVLCIPSFVLDDFFQTLWHALIQFLK